MTKALHIPDDLLVRQQTVTFHDDFTADLDTNIWTTTASDSGTATVGDVSNGTLVLAPSDGTVADNDEIYVSLANEVFLFAANKPGYVAARIQFTEANTDDANVIFGVADAPIADTLVDNGAGPKASYSGAVFFKVDGSTVWQCENSISTTQKTTTTTTTAGGSSFQLLEIEWRPKTSTLMDVIFKVDGVEVAKHVDQTYTSATEMKVFVGAKNGAGNNESIVVDFIQFAKTR